MAVEALNLVFAIKNEKCFVKLQITVKQNRNADRKKLPEWRSANATLVYGCLPTLEPKYALFHVSVQTV